jgi:hypothetical protein
MIYKKVSEIKSTQKDSGHLHVEVINLVLKQ